MLSAALTIVFVHLAICTFWLVASRLEPPRRAGARPLRAAPDAAEPTVASFAAREDAA